MKIISNCPLCEEKSLHVIGENAFQTQQCINCGYVTSTKFRLEGKKEDHEEYNKLPDSMKKWSKEAVNHIWIPTILNLPDAMIYPHENDDGKTVWGFAEMVKVPEERKEEFPIEGKPGQFYDSMYDVENADFFDEFFQAMRYVSLRIEKNKKDEGESEQVTLKLPTLKKINGGSKTDI